MIAWVLRFFWVAFPVSPADPIVSRCADKVRGMN